MKNAKTNNITLIGMPGAGKSTLGVVLAKVLGYEFLDSDLLIQKKEKRKLHRIIEEEGYEGFRQIENRVNASIETEETVIAKMCIRDRYNPDRLLQIYNGFCAPGLPKNLVQLFVSVFPP